MPAPLDVTCTPNTAQAGVARWLDDKTWVFDFAKDVPPGTRCKVAPHPGIKSVAGSAIAADATFEFSTGGPAVVRAYPSPGSYSKIEEEQVFALLLNGAATADSIQRFAYCEFARRRRACAREGSSPAPRATRSRKAVAWCRSRRAA